MAVSPIAALPLGLQGVAYSTEGIEDRTITGGTPDAGLSVTDGSEVFWVTVAASNAPDEWQTTADYVCDADTNDTVTIVEAATEAVALSPSGIGGVLLSPGSFTLESQMMYPATYLYGTNEDTIITHADVNLGYTSMNDGLIRPASSQRMIVRYVTFYSDIVNNTYHPYVWLYLHAQRSIVEHCTFDGGLYLVQGGTLFHATANIFKNCLRVALLGNPFSTITRNRFEDCSGGIYAQFGSIVESNMIYWAGVQSQLMSKYDVEPTFGSSSAKYMYGIRVVGSSEPGTVVNGNVVAIQGGIAGIYADIEEGTITNNAVHSSSWYDDEKFPVPALVMNSYHVNVSGNSLLTFSSECIVVARDEDSISPKSSFGGKISNNFIQQYGSENTGYRTSVIKYYGEVHGHTFENNSIRIDSFYGDGFIHNTSIIEIAPNAVVSGLRYSGNTLTTYFDKGYIDYEVYVNTRGEIHDFVSYGNVSFGNGSFESYDIVTNFLFNNGLVSYLPIDFDSSISFKGSEVFLPDGGLVISSSGGLRFTIKVDNNGLLYTETYNALVHAGVIAVADMTIATTVSSAGSVTMLGISSLSPVATDSLMSAASTMTVTALAVTDGMASLSSTGTASIAPAEIGVVSAIGSAGIIASAMVTSLASSNITGNATLSATAAP